MKQSDSRTRGQVPGLGDIPVVGQVFKNTNRNNLKSELVILIKSTVIVNDESWKQDIQDATNRVRGLRHDEYARYWREEMVKQGNGNANGNGNGQPNAGKQ